MTAEEIRLAEQAISRIFPGLQTGWFEVKSPRTTDYNCIGWAVDDDRNWLWPGERYWPNGIRTDESVAAFVAVFATKGYTPCEGGALEPNFEKIALYVNDQATVTHAARQLSDGRWTSKLGSQWDIVHSLEGVCGSPPAYGQVAQILRRPVPISSQDAR